MLKINWNKLPFFTKTYNGLCRDSISMFEKFGAKVINEEKFLKTQKSDTKTWYIFFSSYIIIILLILMYAFIKFLIGFL